MHERHINWLPLTRPQPKTEPTTQALTGNQTSNLSVCRTMPNPLSHFSQGTTWLFNNEAQSMVVERCSPRRSQPTQAAHGPKCGIPGDQLHSGMLLEGHGQESGCCLVQEPAEFPSVGLDKSSREGVVLLVLQNALCEDSMFVRPGCTPSTPQSSQAPPGTRVHGLSCFQDVLMSFQLSRLKTASRDSPLPFYHL